MGNVIYPTMDRNYCVFNKESIDSLTKLGNESVYNIQTNLENASSDDVVIENLYALNLLLDDGIDKREIEKIYPTLSKYNNSDSPNIQTFLAGIYRKTKIPDAFGPLISMLIKNSLNSSNNEFFDPNEEIGGAILDYLA